MPPRRRRTLHHLAAGLGVVLAAGACVSRDAPGVAVQSYEADLVFGFEEPLPAAAPANFAPPAAPTVAAAPLPGAAPAPTSTPTLPPRRDFGDDDGNQLSRRAPCPPAAREAFPAEAAGLQVDRLPVEGLSRWKQAGTQTIPNVGELPVQGFERRTIEDVELLRGTPDEPLEHAYRTSETDFVTRDRIIESGFRVRTDGRTARPDSRTEIVADRTVAAGEPDRGLVLESIDHLDRESGDVVSSSRFSPPVLYLPLPVFPGEQYQSVGIDARTGATLQHTARVVERARVDACGDVIDGWLVEATQVFSNGSGSSSRQYDYIVATQRGGVLISERFVEERPDVVSLDVTVSLGQLEPSPLPTDDGGG